MTLRTRIQWKEKSSATYVRWLLFWGLVALAMIGTRTLVRLLQGRAMTMSVLGDAIAISSALTAFLAVGKWISVRRARPRVYKGTQPSVEIRHRRSGHVILRVAQVSLSGADLRGLDLRHANLIGFDLRGARLQSADLEDAFLEGADLAGADLSEANLRHAQLEGSNLKEANLIGAVLVGAFLVPRTFASLGTPACMRGAKYDVTTQWPENFDPVSNGCERCHPLEVMPARSDAGSGAEIRASDER